MRILTSFALLVLCSPTARAQYAQPTGVQPAASTETASLGAGQHSASFALPARIALGSIGALGGAFIGGFAAFTYLPHKSCGGCDLRGIDDAVKGAAVGTVLTSAVLASLPQMNSKCTMLRRVGTSLLSSVAGAALGGVAGAASGDVGVLYGYLGGAGIGSALGAQLCRS